MIRVLRTVTSVIMLVAMSISVIGCSSQAVRADDLMKGIERTLSSPAANSGEYGEKLTDFTVRLFKTGVRNDETQNVIISPLSLLLALSMTAEGAEGETLEQIEKTFGIPIDELRAYSLSLLNTDQTPDNKRALKIANSIWFKQDDSLTVNRDFLQKNADYYDASIYAAPFDDSTATDMNNWVDKKTDHMIPSIIDRIDPQTVMFLINALAFDADWENKYDATSTVEGDFFIRDRIHRRAQFMFGTENTYLEDDGACGFIKYYKDRKYAFAALLPDEGISVDDYIKSLDGNRLHEILSNPEKCKVHTSMPKLKLDYKVKMNDTLKELGIRRAFDPDNAQFGRMGKSALGNLFIDSVIQKTHIEIDEEGTKASAVTVIETAPTAAYLEEIKEVHLDRPYVYMLIDTETASPFFIGVLRNPDLDTI